MLFGGALAELITAARVRWPEHKCLRSTQLKRRSRTTMVCEHHSPWLWSAGTTIGKNFNPHR